MSTIRRHGVAFHLIPTPGEVLWLEVIRESDGVVLLCEEWDDNPEEFAEAVEEWFDDIVRNRIGEIDIPSCRGCGSRRRIVHTDHDGWVLPEYLVEWHFDLCVTCAARLEQASPWIRDYLADRVAPIPDEDD